MTDKTAKDSSKFRLSPVVAEAHKRFDRVQELESALRKRFLDDVKFANADSENGEQWPSDIRDERTGERRPCLTINKVRQHCLSITNDMRQNKPGIKFRAMGGGATALAAQGLNALVRRIEAHSNAQVAYDTAANFQVQGGFGWILLHTDYASPTSFNQEIFIDRCLNPLNVYLDPDAKELDKSDAKYGFVFDDMEEEEFKLKYPQYKDKAHAELGFGPESSWRKDGRIRVCDYYRVEEVQDSLLMLESGPLLASIAGKDLVEQLQAEGQILAERPTISRKVMWYFLAGSVVCDKREWPSKFIPIVPVLGEETLIDGKLDRKGHTRAMKDPQRMYNYWTSSAVEYGALQSKTPYIGPLEAFEGLDDYWKTANTVNHSYLPFNHVDDAGQPIPPPQRQQPPMAAPVALEGMRTAQMEMELVSGQFAAQMGMPGNERTGAALTARQRQGDRATFHYIDGMATAIRHVGRIVLDLIPKIYDTQRVMTVLADDGTEFQLVVDPKAPNAAEATMQAQQQLAEMILNPLVGEYSVVADVGPGYATRRAEAFDAYTLLLTQAPQLSGLIGDIMLRAGDFPGADEAAERLRRMIPPQALGQGPSQQEQMLMGQLQQAHQMIERLMHEYQEMQLKLRGKAEARDIDAFEAVTERMKLFGDQVARSAELLRDTMGDAKSMDLNRIHEANTSEITGMMGEEEGLGQDLQEDQRRIMREQAGMGQSGGLPAVHALGPEGPAQQIQLPL